MVVLELHLRNPGTGEKQDTPGYRSGADVLFPEVPWAWVAGFRHTGPGDPGCELANHCSGEGGSRPEEEDRV